VPASGASLLLPSGCRHLTLRTEADGAARLQASVPVTRSAEDVVQIDPMGDVKIRISAPAPLLLRAAACEIVP
jgi:hypothetical protein